MHRPRALTYAAIAIFTGALTLLPIADASAAVKVTGWATGNAAKGLTAYTDYECQGAAELIQDYLDEGNEKVAEHVEQLAEEHGCAFSIS
jgi:hypothetical protein